MYNLSSAAFHELTPVLPQVAEDPRPGPTARAFACYQALQDFYERSFVRLAACPEPGRSEESAAVVAARIEPATDTPGMLRYAGPACDDPTGPVCLWVSRPWPPAR